MDWKPPSEDDFGQWLMPLDLLIDLEEQYSDEDIRKGWIMRRLKIGTITGVAREGRGRDGELRSLIPVPTSLWNLWTDEGEHDFWECGDATFTVAHPLSADAGGYGPSSFHIERYFDVRFHPDDLSGGARRRPIPEQPAEATADVNGEKSEESDAEPLSVVVNRRGFPRLSDPMLAEWHALFLKAYPNGNATQAIQSVNGMFPRHHIARNRIRELFPDIPIGRPRESKD